MPRPEEDRTVAHLALVGTQLCFGLFPLFGKLAFDKDAAEAVQRVLSGECQMAVMPAAVPFDVLKEVSDRGERLPPKSTYFYPKLPTGLAMRSLDGEL